jgi:hypothetical protein
VNFFSWKAEYVTGKSAIGVWPKSSEGEKLPPKKLEVQQGKSYSWCSCGLSNKQPFCDGNKFELELNERF